VINLPFTSVVKVLDDLYPALLSAAGNKTTQMSPLGQFCVVKFHLEDGGVVLRIQWVIDAALSIGLLGQDSIID
jgi:hypothetical protein